MTLLGEIMNYFVDNQELVFSRGLVALIACLPELRRFFDMWHAIKNDKTGKTHATYGEPQYLLPGVGTSSISRDSLREIGVTESLLDTNPYKEMDDLSARLVFSLGHLRLAQQSGDSALALALLPGYLLHASALLANLRRGECICRLSLFLAIMLKYVLIWDSTRDGNRTTYRRNAAFSRELCAKYITLIAELMKNTGLNLVVLGSHLLEHFFALIKRLMGAYQTAADFSAPL
jgi:hypothetical protein